jgi:uncharacterized protein YpmS
MNWFRQFLVILVVLSIVSLACNLGSSGVISPAQPTPTSPSPPLSLEEALNSAVDEAKESGRFNLTLDESQFTTTLQDEIQDRDDIPLQDARVRLQDGQMEVLGTVIRQGIKLNARAVLEPQVDAQHRLHFNLVSASLGPFPLPEEMVRDLESSINRIVSRQIDAKTEDIAFDGIIVYDDVIVYDGKMTLTGRIQ